MLIRPRVESPLLLVEADARHVRQTEGEILRGKENRDRSYLLSHFRSNAHFMSSEDIYFSLSSVGGIATMDAILFLALLLQTDTSL